MACREIYDGASFKRGTKSAFETAFLALIQIVQLFLNFQVHIVDNNVSTIQ